MSWSSLYQAIAHENYLQNLFNWGREDRTRYIYLKITRSYLHKSTTYPIILSCAKVIANLVQQADVSNRWLRDGREKPLASYQLEELHYKYSFLTMKIHMNLGWLNEACLKANINKMLKWAIDLRKTFYMTTPDGYKETMFQKLIQVLNALL